MALKSYSFADLLELDGVGGVSGDEGGKAPVHMGLADPHTERPLFPPPPRSLASGVAANAAGDITSENPYGLQALDPAVPTAPTEIRVIGGRAANDSCHTGNASLSAEEIAEREHDRLCLRQSSARSGDEIDLLIRYLHLFAWRQIADLECDRLADKLMLRDRRGDGRRLCIECQHCLVGPSCSQGSPVLEVLQRCDRFELHTDLKEISV